MQKYALLLTSFFLFSCATPSAPSPAWLGALDAAYPPAAYIAGEGSGLSREDARLAATGAISRYFVSEVQSVSHSRQQMAAANGAVTSIDSFDSATLVQSTTKLFAVHYADAWFDSAAKKWYTAAYIDRAEAWAIFAPTVDQKAAEFQNRYDSAEKADPLQKVFRYPAALTAAAELASLLDFAQVLHPAEAARFVPARTAAATVGTKLRDAKTAAPLSVDGPIDLDGTVAATVTRVLSDAGFAVTQTKRGAAGVCAVRVEEGKSDLAAGTFYAPRVTVTLGSTGATLFSWAGSVEQVGARSSTVAKQRAYAGITQELETKFFADIQGELR
jgi:hypothetical protein